MTDHEFGGAHTEIKLQVLNDYLSFYVNALKNQRFSKIYIDGFAGTGERIEMTPGSALLDLEEQRKVFRGSVRIALETEPPFDRYHFIEGKRSHYNALESLLAEYPSRTTSPHYGDANDLIPEICSSTDWRKHRGVAFVDPYGINANWDTLKVMQNTNSLDVWYLFNAFGAYRQLPKTISALEPEKTNSLNRVFGTTDWINSFFNADQTPQRDLFENVTPAEKHATVADVEAFMQKRLQTVFPYVSRPLPLASKNVDHSFSLFLCVSNPNQKAWGLASRVAAHILKKQQG